MMNKSYSVVAFHFNFVDFFLDTNYSLKIFFQHSFLVGGGYETSDNRLHEEMGLEWKIVLIQILYTGKYSPPFYFCFFRPHRLWVNLRLGELHWLKLSLLNITLSERIQDRAKLFASEERRK